MSAVSINNLENIVLSCLKMLFFPRKSECRKIWSLKQASSLLEKDLSLKGLAWLKPKFASIGSITEGTRLYKASEIDITVQFQALKNEQDCLRLFDTYEGGKHLCFDKGSPLEMFGDFDQDHKVFVYDHEKFFEFFLDTVQESLARVIELPEWPKELSMTLEDWNPCQRCLKERKDARKKFPTSIYDPYQHCTDCLPAITHTRVGPCLIFKYKDASQVQQVLTMDLIPVLPVLAPGKGVMSLFDAATRILIKKKPEGWLKHIKGVIDKDRVLPESLVKALEISTETVIDVSMKLLNYCPDDNHIIRPSQKFLKDEPRHQEEDIKAGGLLKGTLKDVYIRFKAFAEITGSGAKSYVVKKVILSDEMRFQLENPSLNMYERMVRVMRHPELEDKFKDWIGYYNHARQITKKTQEFEDLPRHFPPKSFDYQ